LKLCAHFTVIIRLCFLVGGVVFAVSVISASRSEIFGAFWCPQKGDVY
jgi:hypothetical protein